MLLYIDPSAPDGFPFTHDGLEDEKVERYSKVIFSSISLIIKGGKKIFNE